MNTEESHLTLSPGKPPREIRVVQDAGQLSYLFDTARFEHMFRIAEAMSNAALLPDHLLRNKHAEFTAIQKKANCFLIVNQAVRWGMDPFAVMPETYVVGGKLAYQGKLVTAVVNARAPLKGRLKYRYKGTKGKDDYAIIISGTFIGEDEPCEIELSVGDAKTQNDMWRKDPEQKLVYSGAVKWARRYCPEIVLGVVTDDDLERISERLPEKPANARTVKKPDFSQETTAEEPRGGEQPNNTSITTPEPEGPNPTESQGPGDPKRLLDPWELLVIELNDNRINQQDFVSAAKQVFGDIPKSAKIIQDLRKDVCERSLLSGVHAVMGEAQALSEFAQK